MTRLEVAVGWSVRRRSVRHSRPGEPIVDDQDMRLLDTVIAQVAIIARGLGESPCNASAARYVIHPGGADCVGTGIWQASGAM